MIIDHPLHMLMVDHYVGGAGGVINKCLNTYIDSQPVEPVAKSVALFDHTARYILHASIGPYMSQMCACTLLLNISI